MWDDIPNDIFFCICDRLTYLDIIVASAVCKSWQLFLQGINQISPKAPWLMLSEKEDKWGRSNSNTMRQFFDLSSGKILNLNLPDTINRRCVGVGFGWLLTIDIDLQINLLHPLMGRQISLPPYSTFQKDNLFCEFEGVSEILLWKAVASADPWCYKTHNFNQDCVIMAIYDTRIAAIAKLGDKAWTDIQTTPCIHYDAIFYKTQIYALDGGVLCAYNFDGHQVSFANPMANDPEFGSYSYKSYLVESVGGELLLVSREFKGSYLPDTEAMYATVSFKVFKLIKKNEISGDHEYEFVKVKTLDNQSLLIGDGASLSLCPTSMNGCRSDCIYFTDNELEFREATDNGGGYDMGVFNLRDGTIEQHYKGESLSYYSTPFWYI